MTFVAPERIAAVMQLPALLHSASELDALVAHGLPKAALKASVGRVFDSAEERNKLLYRLIPEATYKRRRDRLSPEESARTERLARIVATAEYVWDDATAARKFLTTQHPMLQSRTPLDVSLTELGARRVEDLLWKLYYGLSA